MVIGVWFAVEYFFDVGPALSGVTGFISSWTGMLAAGAMIVGGISVMMRYGTMVSKGEGTSYYNIVVLITAVIMFVAGIPIPALEPAYQWMNTVVRDPVNLAAYAMVFFFITSAAFRSFRIRSLDTALMVVAAFFAFLMNAPMVEAIAPILNVPGQWLANVPLFAVRRATTISSYMGIFLLWLRATLGMEKRSLGVEG
jgi:hypothetical protein